MNNYISESLAVLRRTASEESLEGVLDVFLFELQESGLTLEDVGSSNEEIANLSKAGFLAEAKNLLAQVRQNFGSAGNPRKVEDIRHDLLQAGVKAEQIGTTHEELERLRWVDDVGNARKLLDAVQVAENLSCGVEQQLSQAADHLRQAQADGLDVGSMPDELRQQKKRVYLQLAKHHLEKARIYYTIDEEESENYFPLTSMEEYRELAGASYEELGTTAEEVNNRFS